MNTFQLDTSGIVHVERAVNITGYICWDDLTPFTQGYIEALFAGRIDSAIGKLKPATKAAVGFKGIAPETLARIIEDCEAFARNFDLLGEAVSIRTDKRGLPWDDLSQEKAGRSFWMSRQNVNAGFGDGGWPEPHARGLVARARAFPPLSAQLCDDGKVRFT